MAAKQLSAEKVYMLEHWIKGNCKPGDLLFSSFNNLDTHAAALANKYIVSKPINERFLLYHLYEFSNDRNYKIDLYEKVPLPPQHIRNFFPLFDNRELFLNFLSRRDQNKPEIKRIVFILNQTHYEEIKANFPGLFDKILLSCVGFVYSGFLPL